MIEEIISKDIDLFLYLNNLGSVMWDDFWIFITNKYSSIPLYLLLIYLMYRKLGVKKTLVVILFIVLLITASDQTSNLFKSGFKRLRPCHNEAIANLMRIVKASCGGKFSYFSAHASNTMSVAVFFSLLLANKRLTIFLIIWTLFVSYSRIYLGVHYPLDVITGIFFGILYGFIFYKLTTFFIYKKTL